MPLETPCPSPELLRRSLDPDDPMSDRERERIEEHVSGCEKNCKAVIADLLRDNLLVSAPGSAPSQDRPTFHASMSFEDRLPASVGRYQIIARLGVGGMGMVLRGRDPQLGREVAIKVPSFRGSDEARTQARQRFLREARAAAAVRHPNVCPIYDLGEQDGRPFVVMALVEGETLGERLAREGRFEDSRAAVRLILKVADALASVHTAHIVHRDLKPSNILLDRDGQPFLADFGLARDDEGERLSTVGQVVGTPGYMAPEQVLPRLGAVGPSADQYSLGVVLYQMLTGRLPLEGSPHTLLFQLGAIPVPPPTEHRPDLDPLLERVLLKALATAPKDRYGSVPDFAEALRAWEDRSGRVTQHRPRPAGQRRLTLLQCGCDLFDSPALLDALDPEEQHDLLSEFQRMCRETATPLGGTVVNATDRGLLLCFGVPFALEDAARRAVRVGLTVLDRMPALNARLGQLPGGLHLSARFAVHSDRAVVTQGGEGETLSVVGQVLSVVDQIERLTPPDSVVISEDTYRLVRGFVECSSLDSQFLKGTGGRAVHRVLRERAADTRVDEAGHSGLIRIVGRDREMALLQERWEQAVLGSTQVVLLVGEAGIGKSRLIRALEEYVAASSTGDGPGRIVEWPCTPLQEAEGYRFHAIESMEKLMGMERQDGPSQKLDKLVAHLETLQLASAEAVTLMASLLLIPLDGRYPALGLSPHRQKEKTFDVLLDWLRAQADRQPVLFVVEDLHWAGPTTQEFLDRLVAQAQGTRLLALLTFRPDFAPPWKGRGHHTHISLNRLTRRQTGELMVLKSGLPAIPESVLERVVGQTDGVPLFVEELTAMMLEAGALRLVNGEVQLLNNFDMHAIPATLQDLLMARLDRLSSDLDIVQLAATIGREFRYELLSAAVSCSEESLQQELAKLVEAELLFQYGRPPSARYQFKHALIRDAAYQSLLKKKRQQLHTRVAEAMEQRFPEICAAQPEIPAHHFTEANVVPRAVTYWERAGVNAQQRGAPNEAADLFTRGLQLIRTVPETGQRQLQEIVLLVGLGSALQATRGYSAVEVEVACSRAHDLCRQTGLSSQLFPALQGLCRYYFLRANYVRARELAEELLRIPEHYLTPGSVVAARYARGATLYHQGHHAEAVQHLEMALAIEATPERRADSFRVDVLDPWVIAKLYLSRSLWLLGQFQRAEDLCQQAVSTAEGLNHPFSYCYALGCASWLHQMRQDWESTRTTAVRALALATEKGFPVLTGWARILSGRALAENSQEEWAISEIRNGLDSLHSLGSEMGQSSFLSLLAEVCAKSDRLEESLKTLDESLKFTDATGERFWEAELHRLKAELLLHHDPPAVQSAEVCYRKALEIARRQQARPLELRASLGLARLWTRQGKTQAAYELVEKVFAGFTEGFQTHDLQTASAFLHSVTAAQPQTGQAEPDQRTVQVPPV